MNEKVRIAPTQAKRVTFELRDSYMERAVLCPQYDITKRSEEESYEWEEREANDTTTGGTSTGGGATTTSAGSTSTTGTPFTPIAANLTICVKDDNTSIATGNKNHQQDVVYDKDDEYFVVWASEQDLGYVTVGEDIAPSSILGRRLDQNGNPVGDIIPVFTYGEDQNPKGNPRLAFNNRSNEYFVVFDYITYLRGLTPDYDIGAVVIGINGTIVEPAFYVGTSAAFPGSDRNPAVAYNFRDNTFLVVYQRSYNGKTDLVLQALDSLGYPIDYPIRYYDTQYNLLNPDVTYNPVRNEFYAVLEYTSGKTGFADIFGVHVNSTGWPIENEPYLLGDTQLLNGTNIRDREPTLRYSPEQHAYMCVWELDLGGPNAIVAVKIAGPTGAPFPGIYFLGDTEKYYQKNPDITYNREQDQYIVAYENIDPANGGSTIRAVMVDASTFGIVSDIQVSDHLDTYYPQIAYNNQNGSVLVLWNRGQLVAIPDSNPGDVQVEPSTAKGISGGAIAGAVIGSLVGAALLAIVIIYFVKKYKPTKGRKFNEMEEVE